MIDIRGLLTAYVVKRMLHGERSTIVRRLASLIKEWIRGQSPEEKLRFLFEMDIILYKLQGRASVELDAGIHAKHRLIRYHDFFVAHLTPGESVLDIGCGNGRLALAMAEKAGVFVTGLDIKPENIEAARARHAHENIQYQLGDIRQAVPKGPFDVVVLSNVLEHLPNRSALLQKLAKATSAQRFLLRVPQFDRDWRVPLRQELGMEWRLDNTHETEYTEAQFLTELRAAGLRTIKMVFRWGEIWAVAVLDNKGN
jgi:2-polyprenyl-3-methyl-5-hydroxy-6-metoxy-1,4-benzoquinol methylase